MNTLVSQRTGLRSEEENALLRERAMKCGLIPRPELQNKEELGKLKKRAEKVGPLVGVEEFAARHWMSPAKLRAFCRDVEFRLSWISKLNLANEYGFNDTVKTAVKSGLDNMNDCAVHPVAPLTGIAAYLRSVMKDDWRTRYNDRYMLHVLIGMIDYLDMETCADDEPIDQNLLRIARTAKEAIENVAAALKI